MTIPQTIGSSQPRIWVIGAGLDDGSETVCELYDPESGDLVVNTTGKYCFHTDVSICGGLCTQAEVKQTSLKKKTTTKQTNKKKNPRKQKKHSHVHARVS